LWLADQHLPTTFWPQTLLVSAGLGFIVLGLLAHPVRRAVAMREFTSFFYSPIAYVVIALFMLLAGLFFLIFQFLPDQPVGMRDVFYRLIWILILVAPAISMRLMSEEMRSGTIEPLMCSPISDVTVIVGKWLGAVGFFAVLLAPTLAYVILLEIWSNPDYGPIFTGYVGLMLVGGLYMAIGTLASALTRNQIIAFLLTAFIILLFTAVTYFLPRYLPADLARAMFYVNVNEQYDDFAKGLIDTSNFIYFLSGIALFLALAVTALQSRKWR
jgi:ABC-2 type transport system permease protein